MEDTGRSLNPTVDDNRLIDDDDDESYLKRYPKTKSIFSLPHFFSCTMLVSNLLYYVSSYFGEKTTAVDVQFGNR